MAFGVIEMWGADLIDMQGFAKYNDDIRYLLSVIDIFSMFGWMIPLENKGGKAVAEAFQVIFKDGRWPKKIWVDKGKEFYNQDVKSL